MQNRTPTRPQVPAFTPVPRKCRRHDGWTPDRQRAFIEALADTGSVKAAARQVNMAPEGAYQLRRQPDAQEFRAAWEAALDHGIRRLEDVAMDRALNGVEVPVYSYGKLIGTRIVHNDRLVMFILRNRLPERFATGAPPRRPDAATLQRLRREWEEQRAAEEAERDAEVAEHVRREMDLIRERLTLAAELEQASWQEEESHRDPAYAEWLRAKAEGRAVILPEGGNECDDM